jgi:hypothetical protein
MRIDSGTPLLSAEELVAEGAVTPKEAARLMGVGLKTLYEMMANGEMPYCRARVVPAHPAPRSHPLFGRDARLGASLAVPKRASTEYL